MALKLKHVQPRRWTVDEYHRLQEAGMFGPDERVELIDGQIVPMTMPEPIHTRSVIRATRALSRAVDETHYVAVQLPIQTSLYSEPKPDFVLYPNRVVDEPSDEPGRADLVMEVSDTSLRYDSEEKSWLYALAEIPEYWILRVRERRLEVRRDPGPTKGRTFRHAYRSVTLLDEHETVSPLCRPDAAIRVADML